MEEEDSSSSLESIIVSIGLVNNPITKASAGGEIHRYHTLLAQQVLLIMTLFISFCFCFSFEIETITNSCVCVCA